MINFAWPYLFLLLPLPWLVYKFFSPSVLNRQAALIVPDFNDFAPLKAQSPLSMPKLKIVCAVVMWAALVSSAARPQWMGNWIEIPQTGRDLMLAVDLSGSMQLKDFELNGKVIDRLTALKTVASDFIDRRKGDRLGLILFGSNAYVQAPLTFDTATVKQLLMESEVGLAGGETAIGDAIGLAIKQMKNSKEAANRNRKDNQVLILLTDGVNNVGELTPEKAAEIASHEKLKIHTIAIGGKEMVMQTLFGPRRVPSPTKIDEKALQQIADLTGGKYFRAYDTKELASIYQEIDRLEAIEQTKQHYRPIEEMYYWPLFLALFCAALLLCACF